MPAGTSADNFQALSDNNDQIATSLAKFLAFPIVQASVAALAAASPTTGVLWVADASYATGYQIVGVEIVYSTAGGAGAAVTVTVDTGTQAPGTGTAQLTGTLPLTGTANTAAVGTVIASPTNIVQGSRIAYLLSGTLTGLVGLTVTVTLKRV